MHSLGFRTPLAGAWQRCTQLSPTLSIPRTLTANRVEVAARRDKVHIPCCNECIIQRRQVVVKIDAAVSRIAAGQMAESSGRGRGRCNGTPHRASSSAMRSTHDMRTLSTDLLSPPGGGDIQSAACATAQKADGTKHATAQVSMRPHLAMQPARCPQLQ